MKFTKDTALLFDAPSELNTMIVESAPCTCKAYEDIFTYARWQALGYQVQKGEKGTKIKTYRRIKKVDKKTGKHKSFSIPKTTTVFCLCQVAEKNKKEAG